MALIVIFLRIATAIINLDSYSLPGYNEPKSKVVSAKYDTKNYVYFSDILIYPLSVNKEFNIKNGGNTLFKITLYDENMNLLLSFNSSPYCSTQLLISKYKPGKYIANVSSDKETRQFIFFKN